MFMVDIHTLLNFYSSTIFFVLGHVLTGETKTFYNPTLFGPTTNWLNIWSNWGQIQEKWSLFCWQICFGHNFLRMAYFYKPISLLNCIFAAFKKDTHKDHIYGQNIYMSFMPLCPPPHTPTQWGRGEGPPDLFYHQI